MRIIRHLVLMMMMVVVASCHESMPSRVHAADGSQKPASSKVPPGFTPDLRDDQDSEARIQLANFLQIADRIFSGGEPIDNRSFAQLKKLGIRTIVSVDGARPDVEAAQRHGLRYVHIPMGYDGVDETVGKSLARLAKEADEPFYIHCHHGRHRGPTAAAIVCIAKGITDAKGAEAILENAGTGRRYVGLWRDVANYEPPGDHAQLPRLVAIARVRSLATSMSAIDRGFDKLKLLIASDQPLMGTLTGKSTLVAEHETLLLKEAFHEAVRALKADKEHDQQFRVWMQDAEETTARLELALGSNDPQVANSVLAKLRQQCQRCHGKYRDAAHQRSSIKSQVGHFRRK